MGRNAAKYAGNDQSIAEMHEKNKESSTMLLTFGHISDIKSKRNEVSLSEVLNNQILSEQLDAKADMLFRFVMLYHDFAMEKKDYGTGKDVSMVEVHTLLRVAEKPGITVSEISEQTYRTKSAVSQIIKRLEAMGYVERRCNRDDRRLMQLYPTEAGIELNTAHLRYDSVEVKETFDELMKVCSEEELEAFFKVVDEYLCLLSNEK